MTYTFAFDEGSREQKDLLGGKGANLAEMTRMGLPVPPGFTVSTEACRDYLREGALPPGLVEEVRARMRELEERMGRRLGDADDPLLVSVRSGAPMSMPGMMDTVLNLGLNARAAEALANVSGNKAFAFDAHRRFVEMFGEIVLGVRRERLDRSRAELLHARGAEGVVDLDLGALAELVDRQRALVREVAGRDIPEDPYEQLLLAVEAVFASWNNDRARTYRRMEGIPDELGTAVNVQAMVFGNLGDDSATGVAFTRNPATGAKEHYGDWLRNAQGEDVVAGIRMTDDLADLRDELPAAGAQLSALLDQLEAHYRDMCDIEFTVERGTLYMLQTRIGKRSARAAVRIAVEMAEEGVITRDDAIRRVAPRDLERLLHPQFDHDATYDVLCTGLAASPGAATGHVTFTADDAVARHGAGEPVILVRPETSPDDIAGIEAAEGVLTSRGGLVSHAAIVCRSMGKPAVVGAGDVEVDLDAGTFTAGDVVVREGDVLSIDGTNGEIVVGEVAVVEPRAGEHVARLLEWADGVRRLGVRANADTGEDARRARELGAEGIGLCRTEHMFFGEERLPLIQHVILCGDGDDEQEALEDLRARQRADFIDLLEAMDGLPVTVRLLDPPLHEFLPSHDDLIVAQAKGELDGHGLELLRAVEQWREQNPMLGTRGVRLGVVHPGLYRMQTRALMQAVVARLDAGGDPRVEVMIPLTVAGAELELVARWVREAAAAVLGERQYTWQVGTMVETPRAALVADELAEHAAFFSFGTNDLTQMTFGFSRDDVETRVVQPYVERGLLTADPFETVDRRGVGALVRMAAERGRAARPDLALGLCGEHGGDPASIAFCDEVGLDYVSCSPFRVPVARLAAAHAVLGEAEDVGGDR